MPSDELTRIQQELLRMKQEMETPESYRRPRVKAEGSPAKPRKNAPLDFGLFLVSYFFFLILLVTVEIAAGFGIHRYTCLFAILPAWLTVAWLRRALLYALLIAVFGSLLIAGSAYLASFFFDMAWDSNCYHKPVAGMLALGWNPFEQTMINFANTHGVLPYNSGWLTYQVNTLPKGSFMIGAGFYALTGGIEYGKVFNILSLIACVCIVAPLLRDAFKLGRFAAFLCVLLSCVNLITVSQIALYYNDGFTYQLLTIAAVSFAYLCFKPRGVYAAAAKLAAFLAICVAVNVKTSAALFAAILCAVYFVARAVSILLAKGRKGRGKEILRMTGYLVLMTVCAVCVLGAANYILNWLRYGDPLYGILCSTSIDSLLNSLMSPDIHQLPLFMQFFVSMFSPTANAQFTGVNLKFPFTFSQEEWSLVTNDANVSGWGILFGGIFLVSVLIVVVTAVRMFRHNRRISVLLLGVLITVIVPVFFIPYLFSARYYLQPFWVTLAALVCLFGPSIRYKDTGKRKYPFSSLLKVLLAPVLCGLLLVNAYTGVNYVAEQYRQSQAARAQIDGIKESLSQGDKVLDAAPIQRGLFYGLFFNLQDEGIDYNFCESLYSADGSLLNYLNVGLRDRGTARDAEALSFLRTLYQNRYLTVVAVNGGAALTEPMAVMLNEFGLMLGGPADPAAGYLAVVDPQGAVLYEHNGYGEYWADVDGIHVLAQCSQSALSIVIDGLELAQGQNGFNIVVYDTVNRLPVSSAVIRPGGDPVLTNGPVRVAAP
jgi:hypothetical protein